MNAIGIRQLALGLLLAPLLVVLACKGDETANNSNVSTEGLSVEEVLARVTSAISRPGQIFHVRGEIKRDAGPYPYRGTIDIWVDAGHDKARWKMEITNGDKSIIQEQIIAGGARYVQVSFSDYPAIKGRAATCPGGNSAVSALLNCEQMKDPRMEQGRFEGKTVVLLVGDVRTSGSDETFTFVRRIYLDAASFLPLAVEEEGTVDYGEIAPLHSLRRYRGEFLEADALPPDFFDPASIGYVERDPEQPLRGAGGATPVYWLGRDFSGGSGLPALTLERVDSARAPRPGGPPPGARIGPGYEYILHYRLADDEFGPPVLSLQEWPNSAWKAFLDQSRGGNWWDNPCVQRKDLSLAESTATIFPGARDTRVPEGERPSIVCSPQPPNLFLAHVYLPETVVFVTASSACDPDSGCKESPYNSEQAMDLVARALKRRP
ncbi:MAG TPA: hypothetical protein VNL15_03875 [Dehalococcoidia bacterium]|nr:hypothetical protein [Dehalococcoidia bacterium]